MSLDVHFRGGYAILFHVTSTEKAESILAKGFVDGVGDYMTDSQHSGIWLSNEPLDCNAGVWGDATLVVSLQVPLEDLNQFEWVEEGKPYREWPVPAAYISQHAKIETLAESGIEI